MRVHPRRQDRVGRAEHLTRRGTAAKNVPGTAEFGKIVLSEKHRGGHAKQAQPWRARTSARRVVRPTTYRHARAAHNQPDSEREKVRVSAGPRYEGGEAELEPDGWFRESVSGPPEREAPQARLTVSHSLKPRWAMFTGRARRCGVVPQQSGHLGDGVHGSR